MTPTIILDRAAGVSVHGGIVRIACTTVGANGKEQPSGTLILSAANAGPVITGLAKLLANLSEKQQARLAADTSEKN